MRIVVLLVALLLASMSSSSAAFEPAFDAVCEPSPVAPGSRGRIDWRNFVKNVLDGRAVSFSEGRLIPTDEQARTALIDPGTYCLRNTCGDQGFQTKLVQAHRDVQLFIDANSKPVGAGTSGYDISRANGGRDGITVREFFSGNVSAVCVIAPLKPGETVKEKEKGPTITRRFMVRKKITDLKILQASESFKELDRASFAVDSDFLQNSHSYAIDGVVGYGLGRVPLGIGIADLVAFGSYTRQYVAGTTTPNSPNIHNMGFGLLNSVVFNAGGQQHNLKLFAHYLHADRRDLNYVTGNVVYSLMTGWAIGQPLRSGPIAFLVLPPQLKYIYGRVFDGGISNELAEGKNFQRAGGRLDVLFYGDSGTGDEILDRLQLRFGYEYLRVIQGSFHRSIDRFETTLSYVFPKQEFWSFDVKFWSGRNLDTLEQEKAMTLGIGFKY